MTGKPWYCDRYRKQHGMTLLEVIVAMTVLAIGITGALGAISACLRNSDAASGYSRGALLAQQVAAELDRNADLESGTLSGTFDDTAIAYSWEADVEPANAQGLYPVHIIVFWDAKRQHFDLDTLLYPHALPAASTTTPDTGATGAGTGVQGPGAGATGSGTGNGQTGSQGSRAMTGTRVKP